MLRMWLRHTVITFNLVLQNLNPPAERAAAAEIEKRYNQGLNSIAFSANKIIGTRDLPCPYQELVI